MMEYFVVFMLGLLSAPHCTAMCGGIASALILQSNRATKAVSESTTMKFHAANGTFVQHSTSTFAAADSRNALSSAFYFGTGKLLGYGLLGVIAGSAGLGFLSLDVTATGIAMAVLRSIAGLLMIAMGLYTAGWWLGLHKLESVAFRLWQPLLKGIGNLDMGSSTNKVAIGAIWGLLPCGLVYSVLALALAAGNPVSGALVMLSFGLGTLPFVMSVGGLTHVLLPALANRNFRIITGILLIGFGVISIGMGIMSVLASPADIGMHH